MSKNYGAVLGKQSGKIGPIVGRIVNGKQFYAARPTARKSKDLSPREIDARLKFSILGRLGRAFRAASKLGFADYIKAAPYRNPVSTFAKKNNDAVSVVGGTSEVDFGNLRCAEGILPQVGFGTADFEEPLTVKVPFTANSDVQGADTADQVYLFAYEPESGTGVLAQPVQRNAGDIELHFPSVWSGLEVHVYGFAIGNGRDNLGQPSNSAFIGTGNVG